MSNLSGQPVPQTDIPDALKGQAVPTSDLPQGTEPDAGAGEAAPPPAPGGSTPPSSGSTSPEDNNIEGLKDIGLGVGRGVAEAAMGGFTFIPDALVNQYNLMQGGIPGWLGIVPRHLPKPGDILQKWFNKKVPQPQYPLSKMAEFATSMIGGGGLGSLAGRAAKLEEGASAAGDVLATGRRITQERLDTAREAAAVGAKVSPAYIGGAVSRAMQTLGSQPMTHEAASANNEEVADRLVKSTIGAMPHEGLNEGTFERLKDEAYRAYQSVADHLGMVSHDPYYFADVRKSGMRPGSMPSATEPYGKGEKLTLSQIERTKFQQPRETGVTAQEMLDQIRELRHEARLRLRVHDPENNMLGRTQWDIATALEDQLKRAAEKAGQPDLIKDMLAARQNLARINAVEMSMGTGGHVRARDLDDLLSKKWALDGGLLQVAKFHHEFEKDWAPVSEKGERGAFSAVDFLLGGSGIIFHHPAEAVLPFARIGARKAILSKPIQKEMIRGESPIGTATIGAAAGASQESKG